MTMPRPVPNDRTFDVIVIGGGLHGCSVALQLARRGRTVLVLEKDYPGRHASGVNAGGVRRLGRALPEVPLAEASLRMWQCLPELIGDDGGFRPTGQVKLAESAADMDILERRAASVRALGYDHEVVVDGAEVRRWVPSAANHVVGGLVVVGDGSADPYRTSVAFFRAAQAAGVTFRIGDGALGVDFRGDLWRVRVGSDTVAAPFVVNTAGAWGAEVASWLGDCIPVAPEAPMMMVTARVAPFLKPVVGLASRKLSFKQMANGTVVIGGGRRATIDPRTKATWLDVAKQSEGARTVAEVFPHMRNVPITRMWCGVEGTTPDTLPVIGMSPSAPAFLHACGFSGHGFQLSPIVGRLLAEWIVDGKPSLSLAAFAAERFMETPRPQGAIANGRSGP